MVVFSFLSCELFAYVGMYLVSAEDGPAGRHIQATYFVGSVWKDHLNILRTTLKNDIIGHADHQQLFLISALAQGRHLWVSVDIIFDNHVPWPFPQRCPEHQCLVYPFGKCFHVKTLKRHMVYHCKALDYLF